MSDSTLINTALCLPYLDIEALLQGRMITAIPRTFIHPGRSFALCAVESSINLLSDEDYYRQSFLQTDIINSLLNQVSKIALVKAWARCELCQVLNNAESLAALSELTIWKTKGLQEILKQRQNIFLAYLQVYKLDKSIEIEVNSNSQFAVLSQPINGAESSLVLSDRNFAQRKRQLEQLEPPLHPELEELQSSLASLTISQPEAKQLDDDIKVFLGWSRDKLIKQPDSNLAWINDIAKLGDRSIEKDEKKSNYQAGTDFENIARQSLEFLGFNVESAFKGGAGGLDLYCSKPYPIVCECKAGKLIPSGTVEELIKLGGMHLGADQFIDSAKLVIGPGNPSADLLKAAQKWKVSIINAMSLQKLVEFKAKYPGGINLVELQKYLEPGQIDYKIDEYIDKAERQIKLRSHIVQLVKNYLQNSGIESAGVDSLHGAYFGSNPPQPVKPQEMHEILIELSSPLAGYLGREKGSDWKSDRFYYLRDLPL
ncbi:hypothetical protein NIES2107_58830 [Nostoc carneum NIES-2107]|nr:hypothetical protein NIES2107_58830 [Nostoc carneum NIES-2107]